MSVWLKEKGKRLLGFSLMEVMVALALLALSFTALVLVQGRATRLANEARNISIATQLARMQLLECKREVQENISSVSDFEADGDFSEIGHPNFTWECHAPKFNMKAPSATQIEEGLKDQASDSAKEKIGTTSSVSAPFITMIAESLGDSVRELVVIVRWRDNEVEDELRVVTHVIDLTAMSGLSRMLSQGSQALQKNLPGGKKKEAQSQPGGPQPGPRPPRRPR